MKAQQLNMLEAFLISALAESAYSEQRCWELQAPYCKALAKPLAPWWEMRSFLLSAWVVDRPLRLQDIKAVEC
eukprot:1160773-Pelagomonas_calceolata.AAC.4